MALRLAGRRDGTVLSVPGDTMRLAPVVGARVSRRADARSAPSPEAANPAWSTSWSTSRTAPRPPSGPAESAASAWGPSGRLMQPWWEAFPGRVEYEYACLDAAGIAYVLDEEAADRGVLQLRVSRIADATVDVVVTFPDLYPFFRPAVRMADPENSFEHHRQPFSGDLCLLGRDTARWGAYDTVAWLLTEQLPKAVHLGTLSSDDIQAADLTGEDPQAEPFTEYYTCFADEAMLLVDGAWSLPAYVDSGELGVRFNSLAPEVSGGTLGAVMNVTADNGEELAALEVHPARFPYAVPGRWLRLAQPVREDTPEGLWRAVRALRPDLPEGPWHAMPGGHGSGWKVQITGLVFPEERAHRQLGDGWMFLVRIRRRGPATQPKPGKRGRHQVPTRPTVACALVRAGYAGRTDLTGRMPELAGLASRHVLLIGLGALGSVVAEQLARAGVGRLTLVDRDRVEPGNLVRHAADLRHIGWSKAKGVADVALSAGLYCEVESHPVSVGGLRWEAPPADTEEQGQHEALADLVDHADVVLDCSAEKGVQQALAWLCNRWATPLVVASATNGGWGGRIALFLPRRQQGCWSCLELHLADGTIPAAPAAPEEEGVQPVGCAEPTFTGTGFDLAEISLHAVRTAVGLLQKDVDGGYPHLAEPVHVLALRHQKDRPLPPNWTAHALPVHRACTGVHGRRE